MRRHKDQALVATKRCGKKPPKGRGATLSSSGMLRQESGTAEVKGRSIPFERQRLCTWCQAGESPAHLAGHHLLNDLAARLEHELVEPESGRGLQRQAFFCQERA